MILVDTNIIIDFWRKPSEKVRQVFINQNVYICGITKAELLHGAKDDNELKKITKAISTFPELEIDIDIWDKVGVNLNKLRIAGLNIPFQDAVLATIALQYKAKLWTSDKHFNFIKMVLTDLELFEI